MLDYLIKGATIIDGTGAPSQHGDVGVRDGRIVAVVQSDESAHNVLDADGLIVAPGFVDPHTHYDAQLFWDPAASPSNVHGVTSVIGGNCGFTLAPLHSEDADYTRKMMARVEGMPLAALEQGVEWGWETFGEFLDRLDGNIGVNAGFLVGHCALRRYVMGADAVGNEASPAQLEAMVRVLHDSLAAGGLGFSTSQSTTHSDGDGQPVASRWATQRRAHRPVHGDRPARRAPRSRRSSPAASTGSATTRSTLFSDMSVAARRPLNWNVLTVDARSSDKVTHQLAASTAARDRGGRIVALTMPALVPMNMSFLNFCALFLIPGWGDILGLPVPERMKKLADPDRPGRDDAAGQQRRGRCLPQRGQLRATTSSATPTRRRTRGSRARSWATSPPPLVGTPSTSLVDIVLHDDLRTILWPQPPDNDPATWALRKDVWEDSRAMLGGSDAGAHLDRMCGAPYTTRFIGDMIRGRQLVAVEQAVRLITDVPAQLFGLQDRGRIAAGYHADLVVFDPDDHRLRSGHPRRRPARRLRPPDRRLPGRGAGPRERHRDGGRRQRHRRQPRDPHAFGCGHPYRHAVAVRR